MKSLSFLIACPGLPWSSFSVAPSSLPDNEALLAELSALRYSFDPKGRIVIEKKEIAKKRIGHSPDLADAVALGYLPTGHQGGYFAYLGGQVWDVRTCKPVDRAI